MGYSTDLRIRVIHVVESGASARAAAQQFVVGISTAIRWAKRWRETGSVAAKSNKGQSRSPLKRHEKWLLELVGRQKSLFDQDLAELARASLSRLRLRNLDELLAGDELVVQGDPPEKEVVWARSH